LGLSEPKARRFDVSRGERGEGAFRKPLWKDLDVLGVCTDPVDVDVDVDLDVDGIGNVDLDETRSTFTTPSPSKSTSTPTSGTTSTTSRKRLGTSAHHI
jgi:hypothetical protein